MTQFDPMLPPFSFDVQPSNTPAPHTSVHSPCASASSSPRIEPSELQAEPPVEGTDREDLMKRLWKSNELIKQLKHIVKAQHGKIEELRDRFENEPAGMVQAQMAAQQKINYVRIKEDNDELRQTVHRMKVELTQVKREKETLRKANSRLKRMLAQDQEPLPMLWPAEMIEKLPESPVLSPGRKSSEDFDTLSDGASYPSMGEQPTIVEVRGKSGHLGGRAVTAPVSSGRLVRPTGRAKTNFSVGTKGWASERSDRAMFGALGPAPGLPPYSKLWRLGSVIAMFWKDLRNVTGVLNRVAEIAGRLLDDVPNFTTTVYMLDSWVRSSASDAFDKEPALFHLGAGKDTVQVFRSAGSRSETPKFQGLQALPVRNRSALCVAVQMPSSHRKLAVLQLACTDEEQKPTAPKTPRLLRDRVEFEDKSDAQTGFTDNHLIYIQLICNIAGGILEQLQETESRRMLVDRMRSCLDISVQINQARTLPDFEQRVKYLLSNFFSVTTVRVLFYDEGTKELIISSAQMQRKGLARLSLEKGVVGMCAMKQQVMHVGNISHHPYIDAAADGLQRTGRPISSDACMLVGALVVEHVEGPKLVGVVQLMERKRMKKSPHETLASLPPAEFSPEEQMLFKQLLRVCAQAAYRTFLVQELSASANNDAVGLAHMLSG